MSKTKKALTTTLGLTIILFGFIIFLLYVIYCYAYYDKYLEFQYTNRVNNHEYDFVYDNLVDKGSLTYEQFISNINLLGNKDRLLKIFDDYYKDRGLYDKEEFINTYLYNTNSILERDVSFNSSGNTNLVSRRTIFYDEIKLSSKEDTTKLGVFNRITFKVESNSILRVDNKELECVNNLCVVDKMFGGIYEISYLSNGYEYYGLVNVNRDKQSISVTNLDSLVKVKEVIANLKYGRYFLTRCELDNCPIINKSYLIINEDYSYYIYNIYENGKSIDLLGKFSLSGKYVTLDTKDTYIININNLVDEDNKLIYSFVN